MELSLTPSSLLIPLDREIFFCKRISLFFLPYNALHTHRFQALQLGIWPRKFLFRACDKRVTDPLEAVDNLLPFHKIRYRQLSQSRIEHGLAFMPSRNQLLTSNSDTKKKIS